MVQMRKVFVLLPNVLWIKISGIHILFKRNLSLYILYRNIGNDVNIDELVLEKNSPLGPAELGLLATVGLQTVNVYDKPHVIVLSTGNEVSLIENRKFNVFDNW
jgi:molybdopterin biosynthesis enzyme